MTEDGATACTGRPGWATVHLFGGPYVTLHGTVRQVPEGSKRLLAFVALRSGRVERRQAAGALWPIGDDGRAAGNLRSALWRLRGAGIEILSGDKWSLSLADGVEVDVHRFSDWAERVIGGRHTDRDLQLPGRRTEALELLPGWYDDWTILERERMRQRMLHALEALSRRLAVQRRYAEAVEAAQHAIGVEPLRESAQRALIEAHVGEENWVEARRAFVAYRDLLRRELGIAPSAELSRLVLRPTAGERRAGLPGPVHAVAEHRHGTARAG
jgi:DNA-binding SARP family transcriptional activator